MRWLTFSDAKENQFEMSLSIYDRMVCYWYAQWMIRQHFSTRNFQKFKAFLAAFLNSELGFLEEEYARHITHAESIKQ